MKQVTDDLPPSNPEAEKMLLVSVLALPESLDDPTVTSVQPGHFLDLANRTIWRHLVAAHSDGQTPEVLLSRMTAAGELTADVKSTLHTFMSTICSGADVRTYADLVRQTSERRKLFELSGEAVQLLRDGKPPEYVRGFISAALDATTGDSVSVVKPVKLPSMTKLYPELRQSVLGGLLREAEIGNFVSMSKVGKSWLGYGLGLCIASGRDWLDRYNTREGQVLLIDNELDPRTITFRVNKVAEEMGVADTSNFHVHALRGQLVDIYQLGPFLKQFQPGEYSLVILDALYRFWPKNMSENDNAAVTGVMNTIASYAERMGTAFALVHHSSKGGQAGKNVVDVGAGAAALARAADTHLILREHEVEGAVVLEARTRSWEQPEPMVLKWEFPTWTPAPELDPSALKAAGSPKSGTNRPNRMTTIIAKVRDALVDGPATKRALRNAAGANGVEIGDAVQALVEAGEIEPCEVETKGGKYAGFRKVGEVGEGGCTNLYQGGVGGLPKGKSHPPTHARGNGAPTRHSEFDEWNEGAA